MAYSEKGSGATSRPLHTLDGFFRLLAQVHQSQCIVNKLIYFHAKGRTAQRARIAGERGFGTGVLIWVIKIVQACGYAVTQQQGCRMRVPAYTKRGRTLCPMPSA